MKHLAILLALALSSLACTKSAPADAESPPSSSDIVEAPAGTAVVPMPLISQDSLVDLVALTALPGNGIDRPSTLYPGRKMYMGAFTSQKELDAFVTKSGRAKLKDFAVNWDREVVAYLIFDGQTNSLSFESFEAVNGVGIVNIRWDTIEPYYPTTTPATLAVVSRIGVSSLRFARSLPSASGGTMLGNTNLPGAK